MKRRVISLVIIGFHLVLLSFALRLSAVAGCALWHARRARGKLHAAHCKLVQCMLYVICCIVPVELLHVACRTLHVALGRR